MDSGLATSWRPGMTREANRLIRFSRRCLIRTVFDLAQPIPVSRSLFQCVGAVRVRFRVLRGWLLGEPAPRRLVGDCGNIMVALVFRCPNTQADVDLGIETDPNSLS